MGSLSSPNVYTTREAACVMRRVLYHDDPEERVALMLSSSLQVIGLAAANVA